MRTAPAHRRRPPLFDRIWLRARADAAGFAHAWHQVLAPLGSGRVAALKPDYRKVTTETVVERIEAGPIQAVFHRGRITAIRRKPDNSAPFQLRRRLDALAARGLLDGPGR